jgi:4-diphosphocytidyl-2-C-methyl-D-erythritol kinase
MRRSKSPRDLRRLLLRAPAKINWTLDVLGRRDDGYHEIDSILQAVSIHDDLTFERIDADECLISCDDPSIPLGEANLIHRAWRAMREVFPGGAGGIRVDLKKRIPAGAGLGGGSADAAATIVAVNRLFTLNLRAHRMMRIGARVGGDVAFFIRGGAARCRGRGERVEPIRARLPEIALVVVYPGFASSTAEAYARLKPADFSRRTDARAAAQSILAGDASALIERIGNVFDRVLTRADPRYAAIKREMREAGLAAVTLTGSGSAVYGCAPDLRAAFAIARRLDGRFPFLAVARPMRRGIRVSRF